MMHHDLRVSWTPVITLKNDKNTKHRFGSLIQKFIHYYTLVVIEKREIENEKWVHRFSLIEENEMSLGDSI